MLVIHPLEGRYLQLTDKNIRTSFTEISLLRFYNVTSGILEEIVSGKNYDNDKISNFGLSISYTPNPATLEGTGGFRFAKQIFQKSRIFNKMDKVNNLYPNPIFSNPNM